VLDRHLHHLPTTPARQNTHHIKTETDLTETYWTAGTVRSGVFHPDTRT